MLGGNLGLLLYGDVSVMVLMCTQNLRYVMSKNKKTINFFLSKIYHFHNLLESLHNAWAFLRNDNNLCFS